MKPTPTTKGIARVLDGRVVITFGLLDKAQGRVTEVTVDVDPYAIELVRDLAGAISAQKDSEGIV